MMIPLDIIQQHMETLKGSPVQVSIPSMTGHRFLCTCPCPNHEDLHPSCVGDLETGTYKCLGCGKTGTITPVKV